jgi:hypothetical protein
LLSLFKKLLPLPGFWNQGFSSKKRGSGMRGDQLVRHWWVLCGIEASPDGLTMAEIDAKSLFQNLEWAFWLFLLLGTEASSFSGTFLKGRTF